MSRYNAVPLAFRAAEHKEPVSWPVTSLPCDDFEKHVPTSSFDLRANLQALFEYHQSEEAVDELAYNVQPRGALSSGATRSQHTVSQGELRFRRVMRIMDEMIEAQADAPRPVFPHPAQRRGIRMDLIACARVFYANDWSADQEKFLRQYGLTRHPRWRFDVKPRRHGKTVQKCIVSAILLAAGVPLQIKYYAQALPVCRATQAKVLDFLLPWLKRFGPGEKAITHRPTGSPMIRMSWGAHFATAACLAANSVDRQRGADVDVVLGDEVAFVTHDILTRDISVHASRPHCAILFCTTPLDNENVASVMLDAKDEETGEYLFDRSYTAAACAKCLANNTPEKCFHILDGVPDHLGGENKLQKAVMSKTELDQEIRAIITISGEPAFPAAYIDDSDTALFQQPRVDLSAIGTVPVAFLGIDPSGLSPKSSDIGAALIFFTERRRVVIAGMMSISTDNIAQMEHSFSAFLQKVRSFDCFRSTVIVPLIENNMKFQAQVMREFLKTSLGPFHFPEYGTNGDQVGPLTDINVKLNWIFMARWLILDRLLRFSRPVITLGAGGDKDVPAEDGRHAFQMFKEQALGYKFYKTPQGKWTVNGKNDGRTKDDLFDAVFIAATNGHAFAQEGNPHRVRLDGLLKRLGRGFFAREA